MLGTIEEPQATSAEELPDVARDRAVAQAERLVGERAGRLSAREHDGPCSEEVRTENWTVGGDAVGDEGEGVAHERERLAEKREAVASGREGKRGGVGRHERLSPL